MRRVRSSQDPRSGTRSYTSQGGEEPPQEVRFVALRPAGLKRENRKRSRRLVSIRCRLPLCPVGPAARRGARCTGERAKRSRTPGAKEGMSDGPSFKSDLLGSATLTILGRPIREVRVARPLVRRDRLGAHDRGDVDFRYAVMPLERTLGQVAARNVTAMTRRRSSEQHAPGSSGARRSRSRASANTASASPLRPSAPLRSPRALGRS